jgi:hypothetical protein
MTSWIAGCLILGVGVCKIYLVFLHTKSLKSCPIWIFQLLVYFFRSLLFSILKASWKVCRLFLLLTSQLFGWKSQLRNRKNMTLDWAVKKEVETDKVARQPWREASMSSIGQRSRSASPSRGRASTSSASPSLPASTSSSSATTPGAVVMVSVALLRTARPFSLPPSQSRT